MVSEKLTFVIFSHFPFFSKSMHPLIAISLWEVHNDDGTMLRNFQIDPVYHSRAMEKISRCLVKNQHQQLEGASLNVETNSCSLGLAKGHLHKENNHELATKPSCNHQNQCMQQMKGHNTSQQPRSTSKYVTNLVPLLHESNLRTA